MKKIITLLFTTIILQGCSDNTDSTSSTTELEGSWDSICLSSFGSLNSFPSTKIVITYSANTISSKHNTYSDNNCSTLTSSVPIHESQLVNPETLAVTFSIGETITTANSVTAKELNNYNISNALIPDIYLLQNNNTTLVFGLKCQPSTTGPQIICSTERPTELDYENYYTKI